MKTIVQFMLIAVTIVIWCIALFVVIKFIDLIAERFGIIKQYYIYEGQVRKLNRQINNYESTIKNLEKQIDILLKDSKMNIYDVRIKAKTELEREEDEMYRIN